MSIAHSIAAPRGVATLVRALLVCLISAAYLPIWAAPRASASGVDHLVISEVMTGGASASDELIELYNPSAATLPLEGLELVYVSASGATLSRRAAWDLGAPEMPPGAHLLVANELGIFAPIADAVYASGMAASGGSVALRIQGASTSLDTLGWGSAAGAWVEANPAVAPPPGASLERLPGGLAGSTVDTDDNAADFTVRAVPDPQNSGSPPVPDPIQPTPTPNPGPGDSPLPTATASPTVTPTETPGSSASPVPPVSIATARALPDGAVVTIEGNALSAHDFTDGGGYVADTSGGIAVLLDGGAYARGDHLLVRGAVDDRFAQRTIRANAQDIVVIGTGDLPDAPARATGTVDEVVEGRLVRIEGTIDGGPTTLSGGLAFEVDDGSGAVRVVVGSGTAIDTADWVDGARVAVMGVVGQRDSSGTGSSGYRLQPRDARDVEMLAVPTPPPSGGSSSPTPTPAPSAPDGSLVSIADARAAATQARVTVRGVVTLGSGTIDPDSAVVQDASGAILLRLGDEAGSVSRGQLIEVAGVRSTKSGMASLRVSVAPRRLGTQREPAARAVRSGDADEDVEARLVVVRGSVPASARRASSGTVSFEIDDGSGPLPVVLGARMAANDDEFVAGAWVEVRGVLGQETTGAQPLRGYRVWPRASDDVRILAGATDSSTRSGAGSIGPSGSAATGSLAAIGESGLADLRVGATLVASAWPELGVAGLLWDGSRLVGIASASGPRVEQLVEGRATPLSLELVGLRRLREEPRPGIGLVVLGEDRSDTVVGSARPTRPSPSMPARNGFPAWVSVVGQVTTVDDGSQTIQVRGSPVTIERLCRRDGRLREATVSIAGVALPDPPRILVGCDGVRPAPALTLVAAAMGATRPSAQGPDAALDPAAGSTVGRRLLAVALLTTGVAILVLAAVAGRRGGSDESDASASDTRAADESEPSAPQLTLVRLPNEHEP